jgi:predicted  nucleic acid-binding Zn-ribbon protein
MTRGLIFVLSLAVINAHAQTPDLQSQIDELRRLIHVQSESINELSGKVELLKKSVTNSLQMQKKAVENTDKMVHDLQQEINILSARVLPKSDK